MLTDEDLGKIDKLITVKLRPLESDITKVRKDMNVIISYFDHEYLDLRKRVERIEEYLKLQPLS